LNQIEKRLLEKISLPPYWTSSNNGRNKIAANTICHFYGALREEKPSIIYERCTTNHMDYLDDLMLIRNALQQKDYMQVINYLKTIFLGNQGYVLQGRIYHNLLYMIEAFMKEELVIYLMRDMFDEDDNLLHEYMLGEGVIKLRQFEEMNIFERKIRQEEKKSLRKQVIEFDKDQINQRAEYHQAITILDYWITDDLTKTEKKKTLKFLYHVIRKDIKTDMLSIMLHHDNEMGHFKAAKIAREYVFPFNELTLFATDGAYFYDPNTNKILQSVSDFRIAVLGTLIQREQRLINITNVQ